jgi:hypothetical protein
VQLEAGFDLITPLRFRGLAPWHGVEKNAGRAGTVFAMQRCHIEQYG